LPATDDAAGVSDRTKKLEQIARQLESTLFNVTHQGSEKIIAEHQRRIAEIEALHALRGSGPGQKHALEGRNGTSGLSRSLGRLAWVRYSINALSNLVTRLTACLLSAQAMAG
jgi:hypothetical protein